MNRPSPDELSELRARILRAGRSEKPSAKLLPRTLTAVSAGAAGTLGAAKAAGATGSVLSQAFFWKWIGIGAIGGLVTAGLWQTASSPRASAPAAAGSAWIEEERATPPAVSVPGAVQATVEAPPAKAAASVAAPVDERDMAASPRRAVSAAPSDSAEETAAPPAASAPPSLGLGEEIADLDEARRAISSGDSAAAMKALERHAERFPASQLDHEAAVLRVEALMAQGQCDAARELGAAFLQVNPRSPAAQRMGSLMSRRCVSTKQ